MTTLTQLADRLEAASGADRVLDDAIAEAIYTGKHRVCIKGLSDEAGGMWMFTYPDGSVGSSLRFSANLDAAMTLLPEGHTFNCGNDVRPWAHVWFDVPAYDGQPYAANGATVALALAAACLRALAQKETER